MSNLGRGLKELFAENKLDEILDGESIIEIELRLIDPNPFQPRKKFDEEKINELVSSIKEHGVFQPIIVKKNEERYVIISGERRFRACKILKLETIPAIIRDYSENEMAEIALIENIQREDLSAIEEALGYKNIIDKLNYTQREVALKVGKSRSYITNILGLLNLDEEIRQMIIDDKISMGHARVLSKLEDKQRVYELANQIVKKNLSVRDIENLAQSERKNKEVKRRNISNDYKNIEEILKQKYQISIKITDEKITIKSNNKENINKVLIKLL